MENEVLKTAENVLNAFQLTIPIELVTNKNGFSYASYNPNENKIKLCLPRIRSEFQALKEENVFHDFHSFLRFLLLHEIGHVLDEELPFLLSQKQIILSDIDNITNIEELDALIYSLGTVIVKAETNAWNFVENQTSEIKKETYKGFITKSIQSYITSLSFFRDSIAKCLI